MKQPWENAIGERSGDQGDGDSLLRQTREDRERKRIERQEEIDAAEHTAKKAKLAKETATSEAAVEKSGEKREEPSGFKLTGGMHIDLDAERKEAKEAADRERTESKAEAERIRKELADSASRTTEENRQLRNDLHAAEIREIKAAAEGGHGSLAQQLLEIKTLAAELGLKAPDPGISDPALQIQIIQLEHAEAARAREHEWDKIKHAEDMEERRESRLDAQASAQAKLAQEAKKMEFFNQAPKTLGAAIGKAMVDGGGAEAEAPVTSSAKMPGIEAGVGESGEADCIRCHQPVAIGPTARVAICAGCGARYPIKRVASEAPNQGPITGQESQTVQEEEEE